MHKALRTLVIVTLLVSSATVLVGTVVGCRNKDKGAVKIGVIQPLSGPIAMGGKRAVNGIQLAVDEFNRHSDTKVQLFIEDSKGDPKTGVLAMTKVITVHGAKLVLGDLTSGVTLAIAPLAQRHKVLVLAPGASSPAVRNAGEYVFRNWVSDDYDAMVAARYLVSKLNRKSIGLLYVNNEYGVGLKDAFVKELKDVGGSILFEEGFSAGETSFRDLLTKVSMATYDAIYLAGQPKESGYLLRQMKDLGMAPLIFTNASVEEAAFRTIAAGSASGIYYASPSFDLNSDEPLTQDFVKKYKSAYGEEPDIVSSHAFDAANVLLDCIRNGKSSPEQIRQHLLEKNSFAGVMGIARFDSQGDVVRSLLVKQLQSDGTSVTAGVFDPANIQQDK